MLRTRLWMGAVLIGLAVLILLEERWLAPWFPVLFAAVSLACLLGTLELIGMLDPASRPTPIVCGVGIFAIILVNWRTALGTSEPLPDTWQLIGLVVVAFGICSFLLEM